MSVGEDLESTVGDKRKQQLYRRGLTHGENGRHVTSNTRVYFWSSCFPACGYRSPFAEAPPAGSWKLRKKIDVNRRNHWGQRIAIFSVVDIQIHNPYTRTLQGVPNGSLWKPIRIPGRLGSVSPHHRWIGGSPGRVPEAGHAGHLDWAQNRPLGFAKFDQVRWGIC